MLRELNVDRLSIRSTIESAEKLRLLPVAGQRLLEAGAGFSITRSRLATTRLNERRRWGEVK